MPPLALILLLSPPLPVVIVDCDDFEVSESCRLTFVDEPIRDENGDGVVHVIGDGISVELAGTLRGAPEDAPPDTLTGTGLRVTGRDVVLRGGRTSTLGWRNVTTVTGFKVGVHATGADGLVIDGLRIEDNYRQRLRSTTKGEDAADWLWPHANDEGEWRTRYGAAICVEDAAGVRIGKTVVRRGQNGIILDRVTDAMVFDNDCSFLSGWGLAMWRSTGNLISRNAFDFCIRGYSHGVYNRGQDSAGILLFEQCTDNTIVENSATHCGDGLFAFAGREALGETDAEDRDAAWHRRRGNNDNLIAGNDFSYAAAHGLELTFSFGNRIYDNRLVGNAICGIWGGYSQGTHIAGNVVTDNGDMGYGLERGGINIEHGRNNRIEGNVLGNVCDVQLWWDDDAALLATPWAQANDPRCDENLIGLNFFLDGPDRADPPAIELRGTVGTTKVVSAPELYRALGDMPTLATYLGVPERTPFADPSIAMSADGESPVDLMTVGLEEGMRSLVRILHRTMNAERLVPFEEPTRDLDPLSYDADGVNRPVGLHRRSLRGRRHIVMTEWGPHDWAEPLVHPRSRESRVHRYEVMGFRQRVDGPQVEGDVVVRADWSTDTITVSPSPAAPHDALIPYAFEVGIDGRVFRTTGALTDLRWRVSCFPWETDPREDVEAWRAEGRAYLDDPPRAYARLVELDLPFALGGPADRPDLERPDVPADRFGTFAETTVLATPGRWRIRTTSDDGIRVWIDDELVIDDWTWHPPKRHEHVFEIDEPRMIDIRVEHFELDGHAVLGVRLERAE